MVMYRCYICRDSFNYLSIRFQNCHDSMVNFVFHVIFNKTKYTDWNFSEFLASGILIYAYWHLNLIEFDCKVFIICVCLRYVSCVTNVASFSVLSILDSPSFYLTFI